MGHLLHFRRLQLVTSCKCLLLQWGICLIGSEWGYGGVSWKHKALLGGFWIMQARSSVSDHVAAYGLDWACVS